MTGELLLEDGVE
jgi:hypothetical protein